MQDGALQAVFGHADLDDLNGLTSQRHAVGAVLGEVDGVSRHAVFERHRFEDLLGATDLADFEVAKLSEGGGGRNNHFDRDRFARLGAQGKEADCGLGLLSSNHSERRGDQKSKHLFHPLKLFVPCQSWVTVTSAPRQPRWSTWRNAAHSFPNTVPNDSFTLSTKGAMFG